MNINNSKLSSGVASSIIGGGGGGNIIYPCSAIPISPEIYYFMVSEHEYMSIAPLIIKLATSLQLSDLYTVQILVTSLTHNTLFKTKPIISQF